MLENKATKIKLHRLMNEVINTKIPEKLSFVHPTDERNVFVIISGSHAITFHKGRVWLKFRALV